MIDKNTKRQFLQKIINSKEFVKSRIDQKLISYLVEASINGTFLKETTIAIDVFGKDSSFDPTEDTIVRVHIYTLRKKLEMYYLDEGKDDEVRLKIPKGHYDINYIPTKMHERKIFNNIFLKNPVVFLLLLCATFLIIYLLHENKIVKNKLKSFQSIPLDDSIWADFLNDKPTLIVFGDHLFFVTHYINQKKNRFVRDVRINSDEDLMQFIAKNKDPNIQIKKSNVPYLSKISAWSLPHILRILFAHNKEVNFDLASELTWEDLKENNIIFIGSVKTLGILNHLFSDLKIKYEIFPHKVHLTNNQSDTIETYLPLRLSGMYYKDYAIVVKLPGPKENAVMIFTSFYFVGVMEAVINLTTPSLLVEIENRLTNKSGKIPRYFEVLFEAKGFDKTHLSSEIKHLIEVDPKFTLSK